MNHEKQESYFISRGTDKKNLKDISCCIAIALWDSAPTRVSEFTAFFDKGRAKYPNYKNHLAGHSLGGNTVEHVTSKRL